MSEIVEKVAKALCISDEANWDRIFEAWPVPPHWEGSLTTRNDYRRDARAAIEALREPTEAMMLAAAPSLKGVDSLMQLARIHGAKLEWTNGEPPLKHAWRAMIDAALGKP